jgi:NAD(P)-dependent dehydrogenase (short-subunit alcohol dehydrogenase family)
MTIADRAVLVTGANRGIGQALVEEALTRGAKRVYAGTRQPLAHPAGRVTPLRLDVTGGTRCSFGTTRNSSGKPRSGTGRTRVRLPAPPP